MILLKKKKLLISLNFNTLTRIIIALFPWLGFEGFTSNALHINV